MQPQDGAEGQVQEDMREDADRQASYGGAEGASRGVSIDSLLHGSLYE